MIMRALLKNVLLHTDLIYITECIVLKQDPRIMTSDLCWLEDKFHLLSFPEHISTNENNWSYQVNQVVKKSQTIKIEENIHKCAHLDILYTTQICKSFLCKLNSLPPPSLSSLHTPGLHLISTDSHFFWTTC